VKLEKTITAVFKKSAKVWTDGIEIGIAESEMDAYFEKYGVNGDDSLLYITKSIKPIIVDGKTVNS